MTYNLLTYWQTNEIELEHGIFRIHCGLIIGPAPQRDPQNKIRYWAVLVIGPKWHIDLYLNIV
jgi:hypothetical protein